LAGTSTKTNTRNLVTVVSVMILVGAEVFGVALAAGWAIAGLFELGETISYVLMGLFSLAGLYLMWSFWKKAVSVEPIRG
jgi:hypothetical protein